MKEQTRPMLQIFLNGDQISTSPELERELDTTLVGLLERCDDIYELIVTDQLVSTIKNNDEFLEVNFQPKREVKAGGKQDITLGSLLIPLSGRFRKNNEITFFCGFPEYSSGPFVNSNGFGELDRVLKKITVKP